MIFTVIERSIVWFFAVSSKNCIEFASKTIFKVKYVQRFFLPFSVSIWIFCSQCFLFSFFALNLSDKWLIWMTLFLKVRSKSFFLTNLNVWIVFCSMNYDFYTMKLNLLFTNQFMSARATQSIWRVVRTKINMGWKTENQTNENQMTDGKPNDAKWKK